MRKFIGTIVFVLLTVLTAQVIRAEKLEMGAKFDLDKLSSATKSAHNTIVAFVPSLTYDCEYASMLTQSFYYYFDQRLAFEGQKKSPVTRIFLVVGGKQDEAKSTQNIIGGMKVVYDDDGKLFSYFGAKRPGGRNDDSTVVLLDQKDRIVHIDDKYRAQGEHLKPLETKLKDLNRVDAGINSVPVRRALKVGDKAIDFQISKDKWLSHFRGDVILLSFYPAAFSGTFPRPVETEQARPEQKLSISGSFTVEPRRSVPSEGLGSLLTSGDDKAAAQKAWHDRLLMSCSSQILELDKQAITPRKAAKRVVVSSSTDSLLHHWQQALGTTNIIYANDPDYSVSRQYFSYNPAGYNNRVSVIIDQKGRIAYIDDSFEANDEAVLNAKIDELMARK